MTDAELDELERLHVDARAGTFVDAWAAAALRATPALIAEVRRLRALAEAQQVELGGMRGAMQSAMATYEAAERLAEAHVALVEHEAKQPDDGDPVLCSDGSWYHAYVGLRNAYEAALASYAPRTA